MRDAYGGTFMIQLLLIFLAIYVAFIAIALNYAKAFRVKNRIIDIIEQNEGIDYLDQSTESTLGQINEYLHQASYYVKLDDNQLNNDSGTLHCYKEGYCIEEFNAYDGKYYKVYTYMKFDMPFFGIDWFGFDTLNPNFKIAIIGETKKIIEF